MTRDQLLDALCKLLPAQLAIVIAKLGAPHAFLPGTTPAERIIAVLGWADQQGRIAVVEQLYFEVTGWTAPSAVASPAPPTTSPAVAMLTTEPVPPFAPASSAFPASTAYSFPAPLVEAYAKNRLAVLVGSGLSLAKDVQPRFPRWDELPERFLEQTLRQGVWTQSQVDVRRAVLTTGYISLEAKLVELEAIKTPLSSARKYQPALNAVFRPMGAAPGDIHRALLALDIPVLATTNYDHLLEHAEGPPVRTAYTWKDADKALSDIEDGRKVLFKIHGTAENGDTVIMTRAEYDKAAAHVPYQRAMSFLLQSYTFLLVGYGINDPLDLDLVFGLNTTAFGSATRTHYALMHKDARPTDRDRWLREMNVQMLPYDDHGDLPSILRALRNPP